MLEALGPGPLSPVTLRFRALVSAMLSPALPVRLDNQTETEVQLRIERPDKPPEYIVILDAVKEDCLLYTSAVVGTDRGSRRVWRGPSAAGSHSRSLGRRACA